MKLSHIFKYFLDADYRFLVNNAHGMCKNMPDEVYLRKKYHAKFGEVLNLENPVTFNEKLQWLKLYDRKPEYGRMVDKFEAKNYVASVIGEEYIIPTLGVWDHFDEINFDLLPDQFVLKCTHDSGNVFIVKDKSGIDFEALGKKIESLLTRNYYLYSREWPYKNVHPRIIAEKYMTDEQQELADYKIHVFNGIPRMTLVCRDRFSESGLTEDFFDENWNHIDVRRPDHGNAEKQIEKPVQYEKMLELAAKLSVGIPFVRADFYVIGSRIYFGELTFFPAGGFGKFVPEKYDAIFGGWIELPDRSKNRRNETA